MSDIDLDALTGKQYDLQTFDNHLVHVQSAGRCMRVGIKDSKGTVFSTWEPTHPFPIESIVLPKQGEWDFALETSTTDITRAIFTRGSERHVLTLTVTNPQAHPKPVKVEWE